MANPEPVTTPYKFPTIWLIALVLLLCLAWFIFQLFGMNSRIIVSKQTTFVTKPLGPNGLPDFLAYMHERGTKGVTPENNAAVLIWQAMWPGELDPQYWLLMADALGMEEVPTSQDSLVTVYAKSVREQVAAVLTEKYSSELTDQQADALLTEEWQARLRDEFANQAIDEAMSRPWASEQLPALAEWAKANRKPLDLLVEAAARSKYYSPSPSFLDGKDESLLAMLLPAAQGMRSAVRALQTRAMWHLGEGRTPESWQDILACFRLARHTSQGSTLIEQLVGIAIDSMACRATITLLQHKDLDAGLAAKIRADLQSLPPASDMANSLDQGERLWFLDAAIRLGRGEMNAEDLGIGGGEMNVISLLAIDWNLVLREGNQWYDRFVKAARLPTRAQREQEFAIIDADLRQLSSTATSPGSVLGSAISRHRRSQMFSDILLSLFLPALNAAQSAEDRSVALKKLTRLAAALAVHHAQQGEYPESLDALVPNILPQMPLDLYTEKPFIYERQDDGGYLLYSLFENGVDDGATDIGGRIINGEWTEEEPGDFDYSNTDIVIRIPEPEFKLPKLPLEELTPQYHIP